MSNIYSVYDEEIDDSNFCKYCYHYLKHDKFFGYCRLHEQQCKRDETCNKWRSKFA